MPGPAPERMYLVDAHSLIFQVFHAIGEMSSPTGLPVNAVFGFARDLLFLRARKPDYLICAFDKGEPTVRTQVYKEYKAHRAPMPDDLRAQLPLIEQLVEALGLPLLTAPGYEADDVIATIARAASARGIEVFICTSDKDCRQLIDDRVRLYSLRKHAEFGRQELLHDWGITPEQVVDFQSLVGDKVDNVPGVPGIGEKTAAVLLQQFGTLDNVLANVDKVAGAKKQENLRAWAEKEQISRQLVRLETDVQIALDWEGWRLGPWDQPRLLALFREWGFRTFAAQVAAEGPPPPAVSPSGNGNTQGELFPFGANIDTEESRNGDGGHREEWKAVYHLVDTPEKFRSFYGELRSSRVSPSIWRRPP